MLYPRHTFPGRLLVIDCIGGGGKDTQWPLVNNKLVEQGYQVEVQSFPRYNVSPWGPILDTYRNNPNANRIPARRASRWYANDRRDAKPLLEQWLSEGKIVLAPRYISSNMAYQGAKYRTERGREVYFEWLMELEFGQNKIPREDCLVYLYAPLEVTRRLALEREQRTGNVKDGLDQHEKDAVAAQRIVDTYSLLADRFDHWHAIDCATPDRSTLRTIGEIHQDVWQTIQPYLP